MIDTMPDGLLPLFPLQLVLLPRSPLPLHIFEDRYQEMIGIAIRERSEFGIVQASEQGIVNTGCTATVERVLRQHEDGRMDVLCIGRRRFEIIMLNDERSYLRAAVQMFDDEDPDPPADDVRRRVLAAYEELRAVDDDFGEVAPDDAQASFLMAAQLPDLDIKQQLLATKSEAERLRTLAEFLPPFITRQRRVVHVRSIAPRNGHAKWPVEA